MISVKLMEQMLIAIHAKDTLETVESLVNRTEADIIDKKALQNILNKKNDLFEE